MGEAECLIMKVIKEKGLVVLMLLMPVINMIIVESELEFVRSQ